MRPWGYVRLFLLIAALGVAGVAGLNLAAGRLLAREPRAESLQLLGDFARPLKPAWLERSDASLVLIGNSRIRDGFDPALIRRELGVSAFNFGVSGGTAYEAFRYAQHALAQPQTRTVVIGASAFAAGSDGQPYGFGFDEADLAVDAQGRPNTNPLRRRAARALSGGAFGGHVQALWVLARLGGHAPSARPDLIPAYRPMTADVLADGQRHHAGRSVRLDPWNRRQMERTLDLFCGGRVRGVFFFEPDHASITAAWAANDAGGLAAFREAVADGVARRNRDCGARLELWDFQRPSAITTEALPTAAQSRWYREAVHFRPTTGLLILRSILGAPGAPPGFGRNLTGIDPDTAPARNAASGP